MGVTTRSVQVRLPELLATPGMPPSKFGCQADIAQRRAGGTAAEPVDSAGNSWCQLFGVNPPGPRRSEQPDLCAGLRSLCEGTSLIVPSSMPLAFLETSNGW